MEVLAKVRFFLPQRWAPAAAMLLCACMGMAQAQSTNDEAAVDPPSRVARVSYLDGDVGLLPSGASDWSDADLNRPITTGDRLSTTQNASAELELPGGALRIAGQTDFGVLNLSDQLAQLELTQGTLNISVRSLDPGQSYEIDTPTLALVINQPGTFRVDIDSNGTSTEVTALAGNATVYGENSAQRPIDAGHHYRFDDAGLINGTIAGISAGDAFDAWCSSRDQSYAQPSDNQYVSDDVVGYQDLAQNGSWDADSDYGNVWYPSNVDDSWAPYQDGNWAYIAPWGWSWVDHARWGFAPYHYGRWAHTQRGWGWVPGPIGARPVYAPALVAFVGGSGWNGGAGGRARPGRIGLGGAGPIQPIGWFPLGPGEIYNPWYRSSRRYYSSVNLNNIRAGRNNRGAIIRSIDTHYSHYRNGTSVRGQRYANRDVPHGVTAVPGAAFGGGRNVRSQRIQLDPHELASAPLLTRRSDALRPAPASANLPRSEHARSLPLGGFQRNVVARQAPPAAPIAHAAESSNRLPHANVPDVNARPVTSNVRVLTQHFGNGPAAGQSNLVPTDRARDVRNDSRSSGGMPGRSAGQRLPTSNLIPPAQPVAGRENDPRDTRYSNNNLPAGRVQTSVAPARPGELPSARFAHPAVGDSSPRSVNRPAAALPQVPQIQRATVISAPMPASNASPSRMERAQTIGAPREFSRSQPQQVQQQPQQMQQREQQVRELQARQQQMQQHQIQQAQQQQQMQVRQQQVQQQQVQQQMQMRQQQIQQMQQPRPQPQMQAPASQQHAAPARGESRPAEHAERKSDQH